MVARRRRTCLHQVDHPCPTGPWRSPWAADSPSTDADLRSAKFRIYVSERAGRGMPCQVLRPPVGAADASGSWRGARRRRRRRGAGSSAGRCRGPAGRPRGRRRQRAVRAGQRGGAGAHRGADVEALDVGLGEAPRMASASPPSTAGPVVVITVPSYWMWNIWSPSGCSPTSATRISTSIGFISWVKIWPRIWAYWLARLRASTSSRLYWKPLRSAARTPATRSWSNSL